MTDIVQKTFFESIDIIKKSIILSEEIENASNLISNCIKNGHKVCLFGNGGSAADAQHIAAELIGRFKIERESIPAISFTTDTSILTSLSNDYSFNDIFSRQCEGLVQDGDIVIAISTSGNSKNVVNGVISAKKKNAKVIALLGNNGGEIKNHADISLIIESNSTARIQEVHRIIYHIICEMVETQLSKK